MPPTDSQPAGNTPSHLGGFELLEKIGEGGMGAVYRAQQTSLHRLVALKILTPQLAADAQYIDGFIREARSAARLSHSSLVAVFDAGQADGVYYYAMEFVDGHTLFRWVRAEGPLPERTATEIGLCAASALKHAWDKEHLIHRDIKPENIIIDTDGNVKLCDLGLSKNFGETTLLSLSGKIHGTPQYMSPEQARAEKTVDFRTDIYSLGLTLYFAVTGQIPFHAESAALAMARHMKEQLPDPREFAPGVSESFCRVLEKMTARETAERYANWEEVARDFSLVRDGQPPGLPMVFQGASALRRRGGIPGATVATGGAVALPHAGNNRETATTQPKRTPILVGAGAALAVVLGIGAWVMLDKKQTPQQPDDLAATSASSPVAALTPPQVPRPPTAPPLVKENPSGAAGPFARVLEGHLGGVTAVVFSANGRQLFSGGKDGAVRMWEVATGRELGNVQIGRQPVKAVAASPDARYLATVSDGVKLWDLRNPQTPLFAADNGPTEQPPVFSADGRRLLHVSASPVKINARFKIRDVSSGRELQTVETQGWPVRYGFCDNDRGIIASVNEAALSGSDGVGITGKSFVKTWDLTENKETRSTLIPTRAWPLSLSPDRRLLLLHTQETLQLLDTATGGLRTLGGTTGHLSMRAAFSPDSRQVLIGNGLGEIRIWDVTGGRLARTLTGLGGAISSLCISPDGKRAATGHDVGTVRLWDLTETGATLVNAPPPQPPPPQAPPTAANAPGVALLPTAVVLRLIAPPDSTPPPPLPAGTFSPPAQARDWIARYLVSKVGPDISFTWTPETETTSHPPSRRIRDSISANTPEAYRMVANYFALAEHLLRLDDPQWRRLGFGVVLQEMKTAHEKLDDKPLALALADLMLANMDATTTYQPYQDSTRSATEAALNMFRRMGETSRAKLAYVRLIQVGIDVNNDNLSDSSRWGLAKMYLDEGDRVKARFYAEQIDPKGSIAGGRQQVLDAVNGRPPRTGRAPR